MHPFFLVPSARLNKSRNQSELGDKPLKNQKVYITLRPYTAHLRGALNQVRELMKTHPGVDASIVGLSVDGDKARLILAIDVPVSNSHPAGVSALRFTHDMNLNMFDSAPSFSHPPTDMERDMAEQLLEMYPRVNPLADLDSRHAPSNMAVANA